MHSKATIQDNSKLQKIIFSKRKEKKKRKDTKSYVWLKIDKIKLALVKAPQVNLQYIKPKQIDKST